MLSRRSLLGAGAGAVALAAADVVPAFGVTGTSWDALRRQLHGTLVLPSDAAYSDARHLALLQFDVIRPKAIVYCADAADISLSLKFARSQGLHFAVRSGGHSFAGFSTTPGIVIDVSRLNQVTPTGDTVTIGTGAQLIDITAGMAAAGRTVPGGLHPTTGAGGFFQGGGVGLLTRSAGIASDNLVSARVVLADGSLVTASESQNSDLFWALRGGGGGNFGVVTDFTLRSTPIGMIQVATITWSWDKAADMLDGYTRWLVDAPRTIGGAGRILLPDAAPGNVPSPVALLASVGTVEELTKEAARLVSMVGGAPVFQQINTVPYVAFMMAAFGCSTLSVPECHYTGISGGGSLPRLALGLQRSRLFSGPIARTGWEKALTLFDQHRIAGQTHNLEIVALGGAANDPSRTSTAYVHRNSLYTTDYLVQVEKGPVPADQALAAYAWVSQGFATIDPYSNGETYQNFIDPALPNWQKAYYGENYARLVKVKKAYDPQCAFVFPQAVR